MSQKTIKKSLQQLLLWSVSLMLPVAYGAVGTTPISKSVGDALGTFVASGNAPAVLNNINANLNALANQQTRNRELYNLAPELNGAITQISQLAFTQGMHRINHRFDEFTGAALAEQAGIVSGYAAGDAEDGTAPLPGQISQTPQATQTPPALTTAGTAPVIATSIMPVSPNTAIWMKLQGHWAKQKPREEFAGYHADATGVEIGLESTFDKQNKVGVDLSFLSLGIDPRDFAISEHDIDSYQVDLYANYDFEALPVYLQGNLSTAYNQFHSRRHIVSGGAIRDSKSSYHGWQGGARAELGYMWGFEKIKITPVAGLTYVHGHYDSYRETSADSLNLQVKLDDTDLFRSSIGLRSVYEGGMYGEVTVMPAVYVLWSHDFNRDEPNADANFIAGGPVFALEGLKPGRDGLEAGCNVTLFNGHGFNYSTDYHYEHRRGFHSNSVSLRMRYEWT